MWMRLLSVLYGVIGSLILVLLLITAPVGATSTSEYKNLGLLAVIAVAALFLVSANEAWKKNPKRSWVRYFLLFAPIVMTIAYAIYVYIDFF